MKMRLKRVSVLPVAAWHGLYCLIFAIFISLFYLTYYYLSLGYLPRATFFYLLMIPLVYCPVGVVAYGLVAIIYNAVSSNSGGVTLEVETTADPLPPAPPSF